MKPRPTTLKIVGHRGAAGHEMENTLPSLRHAADLKLWAIEFDVRGTKDGELVLCHDADLRRVAKRSDRLKDLSLKQLAKIPLLTGSHMPTLHEALEVIGQKRVVIDIKDSNITDALIKTIQDYPKTEFIIVSTKHDELRQIRKLHPEIEIYCSDVSHPFDIIHTAKQAKFDGISINFWTLNPLTYMLCRRAGLKIFVYTVDSVLLGRFIHALYPEAMICTNYPRRFLKHFRKRTVAHS